VPAAAALRVVRFVRDGRAEIRESVAETPLRDVLATIGRRLRLSVTEHLTVARELRVYVDDEVIVVKPAAARYWTENAGLSDADSCLGDSLASDADGTPGRFALPFSAASQTE
jgi:hypothetical protein